MTSGTCGFVPPRGWRIIGYLKVASLPVVRPPLRKRDLTPLQTAALAESHAILDAGGVLNRFTLAVRLERLQVTHCRALLHGLWCRGQLWKLGDGRYGRVAKD